MTFETHSSEENVSDIEIVIGHIADDSIALKKHAIHSPASLIISSKTIAFKNMLLTFVLIIFAVIAIVVYLEQSQATADSSFIDIYNANQHSRKLLTDPNNIEYYAYTADSEGEKWLALTPMSTSCKKPMTIYYGMNSVKIITRTIYLSFSNCQEDGELTYSKFMHASSKDCDGQKFEVEIPCSAFFKDTDNVKTAYDITAAVDIQKDAREVKTEYDADANPADIPKEKGRVGVQALIKKYNALS